jgi:hypothetical protein
MSTELADLGRLHRVADIIRGLDFFMLAELGHLQIQFRPIYFTSK